MPFTNKTLSIKGPFSPHELHSLIFQTLSLISSTLLKAPSLFPVLIKLELEVEGFYGFEYKSFSIPIPRKKGIRIWDEDMLEKGLFKLHVALLGFRDCIENPFDLSLIGIKGCKVSMRNVLSFVKDFDLFLHDSYGFYPYKEEKGELEGRLLVYYLERIMGNSYNCIGPMRVIKEKGNEIRKSFYFPKKRGNFSINLCFLDELDELDDNAIISNENSLIEPNILIQSSEKPHINIQNFLCTYCFRFIRLDSNRDFTLKTIETHYLTCKPRFQKDLREKKMKDDLINQISLFKDFSHFQCQLPHLKAFKLIRKPKKQLLKGETHNKKLFFIENDSFNEKDLDKTQYSDNISFIADKKAPFDNFSFIIDPLKLDTFLPLSSWSSLLEQTQKDIIKSIFPNTAFIRSLSLNDCFYEAFNQNVLFPITANKESNFGLNSLYKTFIHDSPMLSYRNETFLRSSFEFNRKDFLCEYKAKDLLLQSWGFYNYDLLNPLKIEEKSANPLNNKGIDELFDRLIRVSEEQKKLHFTQRYSFKLMRHRSDIKEKNPYGFFGLIKCDLECTKTDFLKKKFPVLPTNTWLEFRDPLNEKTRCNYKIKKSIFDDLNGYSIISDLLFYLLENEIVVLKRIEAFCSFSPIKTLKTNFLKPTMEKINNLEKSFKIAENIPEYLKKQLLSFFLTNLHYKETETLSKLQDPALKAFSKLKRVNSFTDENLLLNKRKTIEIKLFRMFSFVFMSYMNLLNIDAVLGYLLNTKNINNLVLNNSEKKPSNDRRILIPKFSVVHLSFERVIIKYSSISSEIKALKIKELKLYSEKNPIQTYVFSSIIKEYYFMSPYFFFRNYQTPGLLSPSEAYFHSTQSALLQEAFFKENTPINHCKYSILNLPFKLHSDCRYFNKLIFDEGYSSKNRKVIELMFHNLETRYKVENNNNGTAFKEVFTCSKEKFKEFIYRNMKFGFNLDTYGVKWNLDHVIPVSAVKEKNIDYLTVWNLDNIKPMLIVENAKKGSFFINPESNGNESTSNGTDIEEEIKNSY